jgi:tetratricopeptide (TPR) repeat protein
MERQVAWAAGKPGIEDAMLAAEADTNAFFGRLKTARDFSRRAVDSAERAEEKETAAGYEAAAAIREARFGNAVEARQRAAAALGLSNGKDVQNIAALALAMVGDSARARALGDDLAKRFPLDTGERFIDLPTLYAQLALTRNDSAKALEALQAAAPFPLALGAVYVRGEAYIAANQGNQAAAEFQKFLDHRGLVLNDPIGALAHLQIGRAYAMQGDTAKAAYQDFLTLWRTPTPIFPSTKPPKPNTRSCSNLGARLQKV